MIFLSDELALCLALPNWREPMRLALNLPTDVTRGLSARESRRAHATSCRYSLEQLFDSSDAKNSNDLRQWLLRLKGELVAVPLWTDQVELREGCGTHATLLQKTSTMPVRSGAYWVLMNDDATQAEIVIVTAVTANTVSVQIPGTGYAWPAGTMMFPLLYGRLAERPEFEALTDEVLSTRMRFEENSSYGARLTPPTGTLPTVGAHIPAFSSYKLWTYQPSWVRPLDQVEADILYKKIGFLREDQQYAFPNWNRRGLEMEFACHSREEIAAIERFFHDRKGTTYPFFIPTFRGDLRLSSDAVAGENTFEIESSRYQEAEYSAHPGGAFLAFVDAAGVYPQRATLVADPYVTVQVALGENHPAATTKLSFLMLVRFAESKLAWDYASDGVATCRARFIEVADEYVTPNSAVYQFLYLYHFTETLPNGTISHWYYTSYENGYGYGGHTYLPAPFSHGRIKASLRLDAENVTLTSWGGDFTDNPLNRLLPYTLNASLQLEITRINKVTSAARSLFVGDVWTLDTSGTDWQATCRAFGRVFERKFPRFLLQNPDNFIQFSPPTQLEADDFAVAGTLLPVGGGGAAPDTITIWAAGVSEATDWFSGGWLTTGTGANQEMRSILKSTHVSPTQNELVLDRPLIHAVNGQAATIYPGYDGSIDQCESKFDNRINFGGHPFMPVTNPTIKANEIETPEGGKKG